MKPIKCYIGSSMANAERIRHQNEVVRALGYDVVSTSAVEPPDRPAMVAAAQDTKELMLSEVVVIDTTVPSSSGGLHSEIGLALASGKTLVIVGPQSNVFPLLAQRRSETWEQCEAWLRVYGEIRRVLG